MSGTITGTVQTEIVLNTASSYLSPLTIAGAVDVASGAAAIDAITQWIIINNGQIEGLAGDGILLNAGGTVQNFGYIEGAQYGILGSGKGIANLAITNAGTIESAGTGVLATSANDTLSNLAGALISGGTLGLRFTGFSPSQNTLTNAGTIKSSTGAGMGVALTEAAGINTTSGLIQSNATALDLGVLSSFVNTGTIIGQTGVFSESASATIVNAGTIKGIGGDAVSFTSNGGTLALLPGEVLSGIANGGNTGMLLLTGNGLGSLAGLGSQIINFGTVEIAPGADWELTGTTTIAASTTLENFGTLVATSGDSLSIVGTITGTGLIDVQNTMLTVRNTVQAGETILLDGGHATLALGTPGMFAGTIAGFGGSDVIAIGGVGAGGIVTETLVGNVITLSGAIAPTTLTFASAPVNPLLTPVLGPAGKSYQITANAPCFAEGTHILTPEGPRPVEALAAGDAVITARGTPQPVIWHGRRRIDCRRHPDPAVVWPVRIEPDAFGPGIPARPLLVSPDHAIHAGGVLVPAKHLINGVSIRQVEVASIIYHHIELAAHELVWAEGLRTETYLDCGNRHQFQGGKALSLHADFEFQAREWDEARSFAPLATSGRRLAAARRAPHQALLAQGWRPQIAEEIAVKADGRPVPLARSGASYRIAIPPGAATLVLHAPSGVPAETDPRSEDRRRLGIALTRVLFDDAPALATDPRFGAGFFAPESGTGSASKTWFRWTGGTAALDVSGIRSLAFTVKARQRLWRLQESSFPAASASHSRSPA